MTQQNTPYPSQYVSPEQKATKEYGLSYAQAMWSQFGGYNYYNSRLQTFIDARRWAEGLQDTNDFKDIWSLYKSGDTAYANLDYTSIAIVAEKVDKIRKRILNLPYEIQCEAIDRLSIMEKDRIKNEYYVKMALKDYDKQLKEQYGEGLFGDEHIPETKEELDIFFSLNFKLASEISFQEAIKYTFKMCNEEELRGKLITDLITIKIAATRTTLDQNLKPKAEYIDPVQLVVPFTYYDDFSEINQAGHVVYKSIEEIKQEDTLGQLSSKDLQEIENQFKGSVSAGRLLNYKPVYYQNWWNNQVSSAAPVMEFEFLAFDLIKYKGRTTKQNRRRIEKLPFDYKEKDEPISIKGVLYEIGATRRYVGKWIIGTTYLYGYGLAPNQVFPKRQGRDDLSSTLSYNIVAPNQRDMQNRSHVMRMMESARQMQISLMGIQREIAAAAPTGYQINYDALINFMDGGGEEAKDPKKLLQVMFQRGILLYGGQDESGKPLPPPVQPIGGIRGDAITTYIMLYDFHNRRMEEMIGNSAATPDPDSLVGIQKLSALSADNSLGTIIDAYRKLWKQTAVQTAALIQSIASEKEMEVYTRALGDPYTRILKIGKEYSAMEMGIDIEFRPVEEQKYIMQSYINNLIKSNVPFKGSDMLMINELATKDWKLAYAYLREMERQEEKKAIEKSQMDSQMNAQVQQQSAQMAAQMAQMTEQTKAQAEIMVKQAEHQMEMEKMKAEKLYDADLIELKGNVDLEIVEKNNEAKPKQTTDLLK